MSSPQIDGLIIGNNPPSGEPNWDSFMNPNLNVDGWMLARAVKSVGLTAPPVSVVNDRHFTGVGCSGLWAGHDKAFTRLHSTGPDVWDFLVPPNDLDFRNYALTGPGAAGVYRIIAGVATLLPNGAPSAHAATHYPAPGGTNTDPIPLATAAQTGLFPAADKSKLDGLTPSGTIKQTLQGAFTGVGAIAAVAYANLISLPITTTAPGILLIRMTAGFRSTVAPAATGRFRIRVDGLVADATVPGNGVSETVAAGAGNSASVGAALRVTGLAPGAHTVNIDWASAVAQGIAIDQTANPNTDHCHVVVEEVAV